MGAAPTPAVMTDAKYMIQVRFRKIHHQIELPNGDPTCEELAAAISSVTAADQETIKLSMPGKTGTLIPLQARGADRAGQIGKQLKDYFLQKLQLYHHINNCLKSIACLQSSVHLRCPTVFHRPQDRQLCGHVCQYCCRSPACAR